MIRFQVVRGRENDCIYCYGQNNLVTSTFIVKKYKRKMIKRLVNFQAVAIIPFELLFWLIYSINFIIHLLVWC